MAAPKHKNKQSQDCPRCSKDHNNNNKQRTSKTEKKKKLGTMDPCRIRSYLQVACAGLGFEIGEIWWTANEHGSSTVAAIEEQPTETTDHNGAIVPANASHKKLRFVQLYTSKSYSNRRDMLVTPPEDDDEEDDQHHDGCNHHDHHHDHECTAADLEKHKLSPRLVDAISSTAQVVWANTLKQEGLTGRSDIPLHTAVGMPVALDADGNMCVVVMFSPNNIQSTDEAMEYLQLISRSATCSSIPCLMPAFDRTDNLQHIPTAGTRNNAIQGHIMPQETSSFGEGVTARFVSIDDNDRSNSSSPETVKGHDLSSAPKDCFGIPMLPSFAELESNNATSAVPPGHHIQNGRASPTFEDVFDEASYGVWSTIMQERPPVHAESTPTPTNTPHEDPMDVNEDTGLPVGLNEGGPNPAFDDEYTDPKSLVTSSANKRTMDPTRKERLEEFGTAFLGMSVFDVADVWIPAGPEHPDCLSHVTSITSCNQSNALTEFRRVSGYTLIKFWSGAVGRAFSSGNPVWSCNPDVYIDKGRSHAFERANIMTAFAVPIQSGKRATPVGVVCFYSMIQTGSVPFVLRFVQQALHLLWSGLDKVQPHESLGHDMWQDVGPADLGEMAADVEMQHHFLSKKRPRADSFAQPLDQSFGLALDPVTEPLSSQFNKVIDFHRDDPSSAPPRTNFHTFSTVTSPAAPCDEEKTTEVPEYYNFRQLHRQHEQPPEQRVSVQAMQAFQNHIKDAVRQVGMAAPFSHAHVATTADGSKRAHVTHTATTAPLPPPKRKLSQPPAPLAMPRALPRHVVHADHQVKHNSHSHHNDGRSNDHGAGIDVPMSPNIMPTPLQHQISTNLADPMSAPMPPPQSYMSPPEPLSPQFTQHPGQGYQEQIPPTAAPSKLSQNLLSQGMLQNIANQQYQFSYEGGVPPAMAAGAPQYSIPVAQMPEEAADYCLPADSDHYPAPDAAHSDLGAAAAVPGSNGKVKCCRIQGCDDPAVIRRPYCARHSGNRLCEHEGCGKCAQGSTRFCIAHGGGRRCTFPGCDKGARDKFFCAAHGGGKRCKADGCNKSAVGGSSLCTAHGGGRRCAIEGCDKSAQSSTKYCVKHGGGKKCCHEGCEKVARGRTQYCAAHGGGVRCKLDGCNRVAIGKMQLCRAHGGGSRARTKAAKAPSIPAPQQQMPMADFMPNMDGMYQQAAFQSHSTATSAV